MSERFDVAVIGAGAMGAASAWRLARTGRSVVMLEQFGPGHHLGSSHGETRIFRVSHRDRRYMDLAVSALRGWRELEQVTGEVLLEQVGQIDHGQPAALDEITTNLAAAGLRFERLPAAAAVERWPGMHFDSDVVLSPDGGRCWAERTVAACARAAAEEGADVRYRAPVERLELTDDMAVIHTAPVGHGGAAAESATTIEAPVVVVAAGSWVGHLLDGVVELPKLVVEDEQAAHFGPLQPSSAWPSFLHHRSQAGDPDRPLGFNAYGLATPGEGFKVGGPGTSLEIELDARTLEVDPRRLASLRRYVEQWLPGLDPEPLTSTRCLFTSTEDDHFVLDRRGPVVVCSPCSGHGFKFVPVIATEVERLVDGASEPKPYWQLR